MNTSAEAKQRVAAEIDGEASRFVMDSEGLIWENIYMEMTPGNRVNSTTMLGKIYRDQPNRVDDFYDDADRGDT